MLAVSCNSQNSGDRFFVDFISVSGGVYEKLEDGTSVPIQGIEVRMEAFSSDDTGRLSPVISETCLTSSEGIYQFSVQSEENLFNYFFVFSVTDVSTLRDTHFSSEERYLYLSPGSSTCFNPIMNSYVVTGNDFLLSLSEN